MKEYKTITYNKDNLKLDIRFDLKNNTIWLTQSEIASVLKLSKDNVKQVIRRLHESTNYSSGGDKLSPTEIVSSIIGSDGKTYKTKLYNLDVIEKISLRSKSTSGYEFIKWARDELSKNKFQQQTNYLPYKANNYDVAVFEDGDFKLDITVSPEEETVWLTQDSIASLFDTTKQNISSHIIKIFNEKELDKNSVVKNLLTTATDGKNYYVTHYNFDVVLAIGYRVNGKRGIEFRKWATRVLKEYSIRGYAINPTRATLSLDNYANLLETVEHMRNTIDNNQQITNQELNKHNIILAKHEEELNKLTMKEDPFTGMILYENDYYTGYSFAKKLMLSAKERIILVDGYMELSVLDMLNDVDKNIPITIYTFPSARLTNKEIAKFSETHNLTYIRRNILHGRLLAIDNDLYLFDGSFKDIGEKRTLVIKVDFTTIEKVLEDI